MPSYAALYDLYLPPRSIAGRLRHNLKATKPVPWASGKSGKQLIPSRSVRGSIRL